MQKKANPAALLPILEFLLLYLGLGLIFEYVLKIPMGFYSIPIVVIFLVTLLAACCQNRALSFDDKLTLMGQGIGDKNIVTMLLIFLAAGIFVGVVGRASAESVAYFMLSIIPSRFAVAVLFVVSCFVSTAMGTSVGTITLITPIAIPIAAASGYSLPLCIGSVMGGAMFGDNLSMISDTTIAATRSQRCEMRDKFRVNFLIALPAALITLVLLLIFGRPETVMPLEALPFDLIKVLPYVLVLVLALCGLNVFLALTVGIFSAGLVGICCGDLTIAAFAQSVWDGFTGMNEVFFLTLLCGGMSELIAKNGGIAWIIQKLRKVMKGNKSAQVGIAAMVSLCDCATANNTVAIIVAGDMARDVSHEYKVDPRRTASLLDIFSCVFQGIIPYGAQMLVAIAAAHELGYQVSAFEIIPNLFYPFLLAVSSFFFIAIDGKKKA